MAIIVTVDEQGPIAVVEGGRRVTAFLILLLAFIDVGLGQNVMVPAGPLAWGAFCPPEARPG